MYASAQSLDFLAWTKKPSFPNRKLLVSHPEFPDGNYLVEADTVLLPALSLVGEVVQRGSKMVIKSGSIEELPEVIIPASAA
jgi:hypothetical protein